MVGFASLHPLYGLAFDWNDEYRTRNIEYRSAGKTLRSCGTSSLFTSSFDIPCSLFDIQFLQSLVMTQVRIYRGFRSWLAKSLLPEDVAFFFMLRQVEPLDFFGLAYPQPDHKVDHLE